MVSLWCLVAGLVVFLLVLLLARPRKMVFVDKVCLNEGDGQMKQEGMLNMGACLKHSKSLLVLWEKSYAQQLISIFELATFLKCHEGEKTHLDIRPTMLAPFFLVNFFGSAFIALAQIFVPFDHDWTIFVVAACFTPYFMACGWLLNRYFASVQGLKDSLFGKKGWRSIGCIVTSHDIFGHAGDVVFIGLNMQMPHSVQGP